MANVGDLIRINSDWAGDCPTLEVGDIAEIVRIERGDEHYVKDHKFDDGEDFFLFPGEFDIFRKAGEEDAPKKSFRERFPGTYEGAMNNDPRKCDTCAKELGETCCTTPMGGSFCSSKCADSTTPIYAMLHAGETVVSPDDAREIAGETQADRIKRAGTELTDLLVRKNHDYGDSFAKQYEKYGLMSALIRMDDKMRRLETLLDGTDAQVDESIKDTLLDLAGYALLASVEVGKR